MSLLEDRLLRIMELRKVGGSDESIALEIGIDPSIVRQYETSTTQAILDVGKVHGLAELSSSLMVAVPVLEMFLLHYNIPFTEITTRRGKHLIAIRAAAATATSVEAIAAAVGLSESSVRTYSSIADIPLPRKKSRVEERITAIRAAAATATSVEEIATAVGLSERSVRIYSSSAGIPLPRKKARMEERIQRQYRRDEDSVTLLRQVLEKGEKSLEQICRRANLSSTSVMDICRKYSVLLPTDLIPWRQRPEIDVLIDQGLTLKETGDRVGLTRERIRQYINNSGQYTDWKSRRQSPKLEQKKQEQLLEFERQRFLSLLAPRRIDQLAEQQGWTYQKAVQFLRSRRDTKHSFKFLIMLFAGYQYAQERGVKLSLEEFGEDVGSNSSEVGRIFKAVGLEPLYGGSNRPTKEVLSNIKQKLQRAFPLPMPLSDIAYFCNLRARNVSVYFARRKLKRQRHPIIMSFGFSSPERLTYRLASQIYEAQDLGFPLEETAELYDTTPRVVAYAQDNRMEGKCLEIEIIRALGIIYPEEKIITPYRAKNKE